MGRKKTCHLISEQITLDEKQKMIYAAKKYLCGNIKFLCKERRIGIGDIERGTGYRLGYFARLSKPNNKADIGLSTVVKICEILQVDIHDLLFKDIEREETIKALKEEMVSLKKRLVELGETE